MFFKDSLKLHETLSSFSKRYEKLSRKFWTTVGFEARVSPACLSQTSIFFSLFPVPGGGGGDGGVWDSASARTRSRDILFELTL